ncbi:MAG: methyl-accepting chemotaxis protein, partial [Spirochaetaceae bacterium]|nr:methyl-accepting chemotaxis protein [Spirochaetaceae bacterium]
SAQSAFYQLAETANQALFYTNAGGAGESAERIAAFNAQAQSLASSLDTIIIALEGDPLVDKAVIDNLAGRTRSVKNTLNNEYAPLIRDMAGAQGSSAGSFARTIALSQKIGADVDGVFKEVASSGDTIYRNYEVFLMQVVLRLKVFIFIAVAFSIALALGLARIIRKPLAEAERFAASLAAMDFTVDIPNLRADEIGNIQRALIHIRDSLRRAMDDLNAHLIKMTDTGRQLNTVIAESSDALGVITGSMDAMNNETASQLESVSQTSGAVDKIITSIDSLDTAVYTQAAHITESSAAIEEMVANIDSIRNVVGNVRKTANILSASSNTGHTMLLKLADEAARIHEQSAT